jgi:glycerol uptake facilitator-like aquaporin
LLKIIFYSAKFPQKPKDIQIFKFTDNFYFRINPKENINPFHYKEMSTIKQIYDFPAFIAEFIGTFFIVFLSAYSNIVEEGKHTSNGIAVLMLYTFFTYAMAPTSGAHFNPAITFTHILDKTFPMAKGLIYIGCQLVGSMLAGLMVLALQPPKKLEQDLGWLGQPTIQNFPGTQVPIIGIFALCIAELTCSVVLIFIWNVAMHDKRIPSGTNGFIIGAFYGSVALALGRITGGSMNPARVFGPGLLAGDWIHIFFYLAMPLLGGIGGLYWFKGMVRDESKTAFDNNNYNLEVVDPVDISVSGMSNEMSRLNE